MKLSISNLDELIQQRKWVEIENYFSNTDDNYDDNDDEKDQLLFLASQIFDFLPDNQESNSELLSLRTSITPKLLSIHSLSITNQFVSRKIISNYATPFAIIKHFIGLCSNHHRIHWLSTARTLSSPYPDAMKYCLSPIYMSDETDHLININSNDCNDFSSSDDEIESNSDYDLDSGSDFDPEQDEAEAEAEAEGEDQDSSSSSSSSITDKILHVLSTKLHLLKKHKALKLVRRLGIREVGDCCSSTPSLESMKILTAHLWKNRPPRSIYLSKIVSNIKFLTYSPVPSLKVITSRFILAHKITFKPPTKEERPYLPIDLIEWLENPYNKLNATIFDPLEAVEKARNFLLYLYHQLGIDFSSPYHRPQPFAHALAEIGALVPLAAMIWLEAIQGDKELSSLFKPDLIKPTSIDDSSESPLHLFAEKLSWARISKEDKFQLSRLRLEFLSRLLKTGVNVNAVDVNGFTALHESVLSLDFILRKKRLTKIELSPAGVSSHSSAFTQEKDIDAMIATIISVMKTLIEAGANPNIKSKDGRSPIDLAKDKKQLDAIQFFESLVLKNEQHQQITKINTTSTTTTTTSTTIT